MIRSFSTGDLIEFIEQKRVLTAACLEVRKDKLHVLTELSREMNLPDSRVISHTRSAFSPGTHRQEIVMALRKRSDLRGQLAERIDPKSLWETLDAPGSILTLSDFAEFAFGASPTPDHLAAAVRVLSFNRMYFVLDDDAVRIQSRELVETALARAAVVAQREQEKAGLADWLKSRLKGTDSPIPRGHGRLITALKTCAVNLDEQPDKPWMRDILKMAGVPNAEDVFPLLVKLNVYDPDENLHLDKFGFPRHYSASSLSQVDAIAAAGTSFDVSDRVDLRGIDTFTVDNAETRDMDDAISVEVSGDGSCRVGIHITDVAAFVPRNSALDLCGRERTQTLYMPDEIIPMFPHRFSEDIASLRENLDRLAISVLARFSSAHYLIDYRITPSIIRVTRRMDYDSLNESVQIPPFPTLMKIAKSLRAERVRAGALVMHRPELTIRLAEDRTVAIKIRERESSAQVLVSELMIFYNRVTSQTAANLHVPFPFRYQDPPSEKLPTLPESFDPLIS